MISERIKDYVRLRDEAIEKKRGYYQTAAFKKELSDYKNLFEKYK